MAILRHTAKNNDLVSPTNNMKSVPNYPLTYKGHRGPYHLPYNYHLPNNVQGPYPQYHTVGGTGYGNMFKLLFSHD